MLGASNSLEDYIHGQNPAVRFYRLPVERGDIVLNNYRINLDPPITRAKSYRLYGDTKVNLRRLLTYVRHALTYTSARLGIPVPRGCDPSSLRSGEVD